MHRSAPFYILSVLFVLCGFAPRAYADEPKHGVAKGDGHPKAPPIVITEDPKVIAGLLKTASYDAKIDFLKDLACRSRY